MSCNLCDVIGSKAEINIFIGPLIVTMMAFNIARKNNLRLFFDVTIHKIVNPQNEYAVSNYVLSPGPGRHSINSGNGEHKI